MYKQSSNDDEDGERRRNSRGDCEPMFDTSEVSELKIDEFDDQGQLTTRCTRFVRKSIGNGHSGQDSDDIDTSSGSASDSGDTEGADENDNDSQYGSSTDSDRSPTNEHQ